MSAQQLAVRSAPGDLPEKTISTYVTLTVADQMFGIPVLDVSDILGPQRIAPIPLAPAEIAGALNLRGRIVTAIDMRIRLGLPARAAGAGSMSVVVEHKGELYSIIVDKVSEVMNLPASNFERNPPTLNQQWRDVSGGIYRLQDQLLIVLDIARFLRLRDEA